MGSIKLTDDIEFILETLNEPEMMDRISEGGQEFIFTKEHVQKMIDENYVLGWYVEDELKGFFWVHSHNVSLLQIHAHFPADNRTHSRGSGAAMLRWLDENAPEQYRKYMAMIPVCYPDVIGFSTREGLAKEGVLTKAFNKGGNMLDLCILGYNRGSL